MIGPRQVPGQVEFFRNLGHPPCIPDKRSAHRPLFLIDLEQPAPIQPQRREHFLKGLKDDVIQRFRTGLKNTCRNSGDEFTQLVESDHRSLKGSGNMIGRLPMSSRCPLNPTVIVDKHVCPHEQ